MADKYEHLLPSKTVEMTDYIRVLGEDDASYKNSIESVAAALIELYDGSMLGGSYQTLQTAITAHTSYINDIYGRVLTDAELTELETILGIGE